MDQTPWQGHNHPHRLNCNGISFLWIKLPDRVTITLTGLRPPCGSKRQMLSQSPPIQTDRPRHSHHSQTETTRRWPHSSIIDHRIKTGKGTALSWRNYLHARTKPRKIWALLVLAEQCVLAFWQEISHHGTSLRSIIHRQLSWFLVNIWGTATMSITCSHINTSTRLLPGTTTVL